MNSNQSFRAFSRPFVRSSVTTGSIMYDVILALVPAAGIGIWRFGTHAFLILLSAVVSAVGLEYALNSFLGRSSSLRDGSAALSGLLLGLSLPPDVPVYIPMIGAAAAVLVIKGVFGGLGKNRLNPALGGRCLLTVAFGGAMTAYLKGSGISAALAAADPVRFLLGTSGAVIGGSVIALAAGGIWLIAIGVLHWQIPASSLVSFIVFTLIFGKDTPALGQILFFLSCGGMLAMVFMASDPVTSPVTKNGKLVFGAVVGLAAVLLGKVLAPAEAFCCAVLLADLAVPLIEKRTI